MNGYSIGFAPGTLSLWVALLCGLTSVAFYLWAFRLQQAVPAGAISFDESRGSAYDHAVGMGRRFYAAFTFAVVIASALLMRLLLSHDFRISYVASYSGRDLPLRYLVSTFWAGQEGSFLLWLFWGALIGLAVYRTAREQEPPVMVVYLLTFLGLVAILCKQPPFRFLEQIPPDGQGLNPLLQDPWMVIHPPVMFIGFASLSVPFAFAIGALWSKRWDGWVVRAMPWTLVTFLTLGTAILMGGYWAYKTLGWGGYWAWDPVENTSLVPWLATVALVHGMFLQRTREKHRKINLVLAIAAFCCILYGTFLTRSGVLADFSVHSFVDLGITGWLVFLILFFLVGGLGLLAYRWKEIPKDPTLDPATGQEKDEPFLSRSVLFILAVTLLCASGVVILLGTSAPIITRLTGKASQVATSFYNVTHTPLAAVMGLLVALVPFLSWRGETWAGLGRKALLAAFAGLLGGGVAFAAGARGAFNLAIIAFCVFGFWANLSTVVLFVRRRAIATMGGYLAHVGVAVMLVGILVSGVYEQKQTVTLHRDQPLKVGRHELTFTRTVFVTENGQVKEAGELDPESLSDRRAKQSMEVKVLSPTGRTWMAYPKMYLNERTEQMMANPDVKSTALLDLYVSPQAYQPAEPARTEGTLLTLRKGEEQSQHGFTFKFLDFSADLSQMSEASQKVIITSRFGVTAPGGTPTEVQALYSMQMGMVENPEVAVPGTSARIRVRRMSANEGAIEIEALGLDPKGDLKPATPESFSMDVTTKPLISLVWGGFYIMMLGGIVSLWRRGREARGATGAAAAATMSRPGGPGNGASTSTVPAVPA